MQSGLPNPQSQLLFCSQSPDHRLLLCAKSSHGCHNSSHHSPNPLRHPLGPFYAIFYSFRPLLIPVCFQAFETLNLLNIPDGRSWLWCPSSNCTLIKTCSCQVVSFRSLIICSVSGHARKLGHLSCSSLLFSRFSHSSGSCGHSKRSSALAFIFLTCLIHHMFF